MSSIDTRKPSATRILSGWPVAIRRGLLLSPLVVVGVAMWFVYLRVQRVENAYCGSAAACIHQNYYTAGLSAFLVFLLFISVWLFIASYKPAPVAQIWWGGDERFFTMAQAVRNVRLATGMLSLVLLLLIVLLYGHDLI